MKKLIVILKVFIVFNANILFAQTGVTGIYKTANDFLTGKITHSSKRTHLKLHETFKKEMLDVKCNDSTFSYHKKDLFGYIDKDGNTYRFFNNEIFPILNPNEKILIYKKTIGAGGKSSPLVTKYFFSKNENSEILSLTLENIEKSFEGNKAFDEIIEINFKNDEQLPEYDEIHKMYKINRLLELSKQGK